MWYYIGVKGRGTDPSRLWVYGRTFTVKAVTVLPFRQTEFLEKKFKKPLDKSPQMWYNKDVLKRGTKKLGRDLPREMEIDTMANKMTNKGALQFVLDTYDVPEDVAEKLTSMLSQLEKKSGAERKPTARQVENAKIKDKILSQMEQNVLYTVGDMLKKFDTSEDMTSQRLTALLSQMTDDGSVTKTKEKGKSLFSLAE